MMKANFDSMYSCTACKTSYNVLSHSHVIFWWLGHFVGEGREMDIWGRGGEGWCKIDQIQILDLGRLASLGLVLISSNIFEL